MGFLNEVVISVYFTHSIIVCSVKKGQLSSSHTHHLSIHSTPSPFCVVQDIPFDVHFDLKYPRAAFYIADTTYTSHKLSCLSFRNPLYHSMFKQ